VGGHFAPLKAGETSPASMVTFTFTRPVTLGGVSVLTGGAPGLDFANARTGTCAARRSYSAGDSCTVAVTFSPKHAGGRYGAVVLKDEAGSRIGLRPLFGSAVTPVLIFPPGVTTSAVSGFTDPEGVAVDASGNLYVADYDTSTLYKETLSGSTYTQTTIGSGLSGPWAVALDGAGDVYVTDFTTGSVYKETPSGPSYTQSLVASGFISPDGVAVDGSGTVFVCDFGFPPAGPPAEDGGLYRITNVGGAAASQQLLGSGVNFPAGITIDASGDLFVTNYGSYNSTTELYSGGALYEFQSFGGGVYNQSTVNLLVGAPSVIPLVTPTSVAIDPRGVLYVTDDNNFTGFSGGVIYELTPLGGGNYEQSTLISGLNSPEDVVFDAAGNLYYLNVAQSSASSLNAVYKVDYVDAPVLSFPNTNVGSSSAKQTVTLENIGNATLDFEIPASGDNPSIPLGYTLDSSSADACPSVSSAASQAGTLASSAFCTLTLAFAPPATGSFDLPVAITDNNLGAGSPNFATQSIPLQGLGTGTDRAASLKLTAPGTVTAGTNNQMTIQAIDALGNVDTDYNGTVAFTSSDPTFINPGLLTLSAGQGIVNFVLNIAGSQSITAIDIGDAALSATKDISVNAGPVSHLIVSGPSTGVAGTPFSITVSAQDAFGNTATTYTGTVHFTSTDPSATLPADSTLMNGAGTFSATLRTPGAQSITAIDTLTGSLTGTSGTIVVSAPSLVVTNTNDSGAGSLRQALLDAAGDGAGNITFDAAVFPATNTAAANTITLASGTLSIPSNTSIAGPTSGAGATLSNLVTVDGASASAVFTVGAGVSAASISGLTITHGSNAAGGCIANSGVLTVTNSTVSACAATATGGANATGGGIYNAGTLTLTGSTISGNAATSTGGGLSSGGGIFSNGAALTVADSTVSGNSASSDTGSAGGGVAAAGGSLTVRNSTIAGNSSDLTGGGLASESGTVNLANAIVSGNTAPTGPDFFGSAYNDLGGNVVGGDASLAPLASYGGPTQTMLPLPGSPALCGGLTSNDAPLSADQRGFPFDHVCPSTSVDAGAVQTSYALAFTTEPPAVVSLNQAFLPAPVVGLTESTVPVASSISVPVAMTDSATVLGGTTTANLVAGSATFSNLIVASTESTDTLTATLALAPSINLTAVSNPFAVLPGQTLTFTPPAAVNYGAAAINLSAYASASSGLAVSFQVISGPGSLSGTVLSFTGAGSVVVEADQGGNGSFGPASPVQKTIVVSPAVLKVTAFSYTRSYGAALPPTFAYSITGFVNGDTQSVVGGAPNLSTTAAPGSTPGAYPITPAAGSLSAASYTFQFVPGTLTITPAVLTVTGFSYTRTYGAGPPSTLQYGITGLVNGDSLSVVGGAPAMGTTATTASPVGTYPITPALGTLSAANYTFQFSNGTLTVAPAVLKVAAYNYSRYYRAALPSLFAYSITGFVNGESQATATTGAPNITTTAVEGSPAASYPILVSIGTLAAANYSFQLQNGTLTITPFAVLTVTPFNYTRTYGTGAPAAPQYTISGFVGGDTISVVSGAPSISTTATASSPVGSYAITASLGTLTTTSPNYTFAFAPGTFTVTPAVLKVTALSYTRTYGAALPSPFGYSITGFVNGEGVGLVSGSPTVTTTATSSSPVGSYPISVAAGTLAAPNYTFQAAPGTLAITPAVLTVTAFSYTRAAGAALPATFAYSITGFENGENAGVVSGAPLITTTAVQGSPPGGYPIVPALGTLSAANYSFGFIDGTLTITP
jgi:sugar lactone lactonase YvrE